MGGVGKTTIMKLIQNQLLKEKEEFNIVIWITVSKEMSIIELQNRIARAMKETLDEDDVIIRAGMIYEMLSRKGKYVLILDDLWHRLSLEKVGIPEPSNGSKVLVTTRSSDVCRYLKCRDVKVPTLSKPDAWGLFSKKVGPDVLSHPDLLPIVKSVAEECAGLPLAIVTIASSMNGVCNVHEWRNALHELTRHVKSVNGILEEEVFQILQFSYDRLQDEKVKHCFLCCALYPEDFEIKTGELINLWIAEGLVEEMDSMQKEIDKGHTILNKLKNSCLIEKGTSYRGDEVKLHDVVRDMAFRITSVRPRFWVRADMRLKEIPDVKDWNEDLEKASMMNNRELQIPSQMPPPKCPKLTTLLLSNCSIKSIPECFFEQMHGLKILDLSYNCGLKSLPNSISNLETLTTLLVRGCYDLEKVPSFSKLEALKKLDLGGTNIKDLPHGMERLVNLKYLDLWGLKEIEIGDGIWAKFTSLRNLYLGDRLVRGEEIGGLRKLEFFEGGFYDLNEWKSFVQALHASKSGLHQYNIFVGPEDYSYVDEQQDKVIALNCCYIYTDDFKILSNVEELHFRKCIVDLCEEGGAFLSRCIPVSFNIFSSLSQLFIIECKNIKKLLSSNWVLHNLQNLRELWIEGCAEMEEIIASELEEEEEEEEEEGEEEEEEEEEGEGEEEEGGEEEEEEGEEEEGISSLSFNFTLPKLWLLSLKNLPELKSICGANGVLVCDSIYEIHIISCPKLKRIPLNLPLQDDGQPSRPPSLRRIIISPEEIEWWELVEWDHPNTEFLLEPLVHFDE